METRGELEKTRSPLVNKNPVTAAASPCGPPFFRLWGRPAALLFGKSGNAELSVDEVAAAADTINYELVCILGKRVPRVFIRDGKVLTVTDYICNR